VERWSRKQLISYAVEAIDRDEFRGVEGAAEASERLNARKMSLKELRYWAEREVEWRMLHD
jgi:hypothetical protein